MNQISLIRRLTKNVTMLFDSDKAGVNATERALEFLLSQGMNIDICILNSSLKILILLGGIKPTMK